MEGDLCRRHHDQLEGELAASGKSLIDDLVSGRVNLGDAISGAVTSYAEKIFGENPWLRDIDQVAREAHARAQSRRSSPSGAPPRSSPPPGGSASRPPPPPGPRGPAPPPPRPDPAAQLAKAREILGFADLYLHLTPEIINDRRKQLAKVFHPDKPGGSLEQMKRVNLAADLLLADLAKRR